MNEFILIGQEAKILKVDAGNWLRHLEQRRHTPSTRLNFMTSDHHRVRNFAVRELPRNHGHPLSAQTISLRLDLPLSRVVSILDDLQQHLFFVVLNAAREVCWAYPVTTEKTLHHLRFSTGERSFAAWAEDAMAAPFVQGHLRNENLSVEIETACAHCGQPLHLTVNSDLQWSVSERDARPLLFGPEVDWLHFKDATIIDAYWRNSVFFWSEEHARAGRTNYSVEGIYLTLAQSAYATRIAQSALFGFNEISRPVDNWADFELAALMKRTPKNSQSK